MTTNIVFLVSKAYSADANGNRPLKNRWARQICEVVMRLDCQKRIGKEKMTSSGRSLPDKYPHTVLSSTNPGLLIQSGMLDNAAAFIDREMAGGGENGPI